MVKVQTETEGNLILHALDFSVTFQTSLNPHHNSKNRHKGGGFRDRVIEAHRC